MFSSIDDLLSYYEGDGFFYRMDFRVKVLWLLLTILAAVIMIDMIFTIYLLICTLFIEKLGRSPVFMKIRRNKTLVTFVFGMVIITFVFAFLNTALYSRELTPQLIFFYIARSIALGVTAVMTGTLFLSILQTTRVIAMTAGRGPSVSILTFLSFRSVPLVAYHLNNVIDAQRARGLEMEKMGPRSILKSIKAILIPLLIVLTGSIDRTSKVLEARGINPRVKNKTSYIKPSLTKLDVFVIFYTLFQLIVSALIAINYNPNYPLKTFTYNLFIAWGLI
jgi:energy-coupling factor transport system permease protein